MQRILDGTDDLGTFKVSTRVPSTLLLRIVSFSPGPAGCRSNVDECGSKCRSNQLFFLSWPVPRRAVEMQREREREKGRRFSPLLHRDSASLLPFQGYSCVAFRTGTFQHFRFALSSRNLRFLFARRGNKNPLSSHICAWFLLFRSSWDSCVKCIIIWIVPILFDSLSLSLSLSFSLFLSLSLSWRI